MKCTTRNTRGINRGLTFRRPPNSLSRRLEREAISIIGACVQQRFVLKVVCSVRPSVRQCVLVNCALIGDLIETTTQGPCSDYAEVRL